MSEVVAILGVLGAGKDHHADGFVAMGYVRIDFKDELLNMVSDMCGFDVRKEYDFFKHAIVGVRQPGTPIQCGMVRSDMKDFAERNPGVMTGRKLLQRMGTDVMRKRNPNYWVDSYRVRVEAVCEPVVTADCRFANEVQAIRDIGKHRFIFADYRSYRYDANATHESEWLAQALLKLGLKDGEEIGEAAFEQAAKIVEVREEQWKQLVK